MPKTKRRHSRTRTRTRSRRGGFGEYSMAAQQQPTMLDSASTSASNGLQKSKEGIMNGWISAKNWLGIGTQSGGRRKRRSRTSRSRHNKRGGSVVRAYNTYVDSSTKYASPVSGYQTAKPHNWVGGKRRTKRYAY